MKFGSVPLNEALGGILAHSVQLEDGTRLRKGIFLEEVHIQQLKDAGRNDVTVALLHADDVLEDDAATQIAKKFGGGNYRIDAANTGRVNIFSSVNGVFRVDASKINAMNAVHPEITIATLPDYASVNEGRLIGTIKIIPYAVSSAVLDHVLALDLADIFHVEPYQAKRIGIVSTMLPALKPSVMDKTRRVLEGRLALSGSTIMDELRVDHDVEAVKSAIAQLVPQVDMVILFGASAISDVRDVIPAAIEGAGGTIIRFGMPVDPGNLMLLAELDGKSVIGAPGCARSPAENGFDRVLQRILADVDVIDDHIMGMGVGGLLMETGARPHPRQKSVKGREKIAAIVLAAGQSRRMGDLNKMTVLVRDKPMVRHVVDAVTESKADRTLIVTGYRPNDVETVVQGVKCDLVHNPEFEEGLSTSLRRGIQGLGDDVGRAIILLGDMPFVSSNMIDKLIDASDQNPGRIVISTHNGKRGNPVLWPRRFFEELLNISGDTGARHLIGVHHDLVVEVELGEAAGLDIDTQEVLGKLESS